MVTFEEFKTEVNSWLPQIKTIAQIYFHNDITPLFKTDNSPVTIADKEIETYLINRITQKYPEHSIVGEETGIIEHQSDYQWVLDPIDGTQSFIHHVPLFSTLIALLKDGIPLYGCIYLPLMDEILMGDGNIALLNGAPVKMRNREKIDELTILTSNILSIGKYHNGHAFSNLIGQCRCFRTWGDGFGYYLLATGRADVMVDPHMKIWDIMALIPVIRGAGGTITDYYGNNPAEGTSIIAASPAIHPFIIEALK